MIFETNHSQVKQQAASSSSARPSQPVVAPASPTSSQEFNRMWDDAVFGDEEPPAMSPTDTTCLAGIVFQLLVGARM
jgi:hypothetical protein